MGSEMCIRDRGMAQHRRAAGGGVEQPREHLEGGGLARAIGPQEADDLPRLQGKADGVHRIHRLVGCLLYTSDAADDLPCVDLGGRRSIKKKK